MTENDTGIRPDRRKGPDLWTKILRWLGVFGWFVMIVALYVIDRARPEEENMFTFQPEASGLSRKLSAVTESSLSASCRLFSCCARCSFPCSTRAALPGYSRPRI